MGERAVVAVFGPETVYWYRSQWGGSEERLGDVFDAEKPVEKLFEVEWRFLTTGSPTGADCPVDTLTTDVCYLVRPERVEVYVALWFGLGLPDTPASTTRGVLVPVDSLEGVRRCRSAVRAFKGLVLDYVTEGTVPPEVARSIVTQVCVLVQRLVFQFHRVPNV